MISFSRRTNGKGRGRSRQEDRLRAGRNRRAISLDCLESRTLLAAHLSIAGQVAQVGSTQGVSGGTFSQVAQFAPNFSNTMMLETDGTVLMQGSNVSNAWYRLTPDSSGSYANGVWSKVASMSLQRLYFGSNILPDGRVFVQGGEYSGPYGVANDTNTGEIYNPVTNSWSTIATFPRGIFGDDPSVVLADGKVLTGYIVGAETYLYNPTTNAWTSGGTKLRGDSSDEEAWVKLADNSILSYDVFASISSGVGHAQRYLPSTNTWVDAGIVPVQLSSPSVGYELGPGFLLPDGRAFYLGANGNTAYYTPSTNSWTAGPVIPGGLAADDAPGTMLPGGKILFTADTPLFHGPTHIFEFDPTTNQYTDLTSLLPSGYLNGPSYIDRMLMLPSGQVLINNGGSRLELFTPSDSPLPASIPTISGISENADGSFTMSGTGLNGISEGAGYGDDAEMSSNYPIVRFTDSSNHVYYARTYGWSSLIATGSTPVTTNFTLPVGLPAGGYSVSVVANGSPSSPFAFSTPTNPTDPAPTIAIAASASPTPDPGTTASLSALGADTAGESTLSYTWAATAVPSGAAYPSFSTNGTNGSKNETVTFTHAGSYTFRVTATNLAGLSVSSTVNLTVTQTLTSILVSSSPVNLSPDSSMQFSATGLDQFGLSLASQPGFAWSLTSGNGTLSAGGFYTAPPSGTLATVTATSNAVSGSASVYVLSPPLTSQDIYDSNVNTQYLTGAAGDDSNGHYTLINAGTDIYGTSDQFQYAYTTLSGDGTLVARVTSIQNTNTFAKAGVMFRNDLGAGSAETFMAITAGSGATFESRASASASTGTVGTGGIGAPYWVKLVRSGNTFTGYYSPDGVTWTFEGSANVSMNFTAYIGLALTSHDRFTLNTSTFDHVNLYTAPTIQAVASATPSPVLGTTTNLSVLGADNASETTLTYSWAATSVPNGAATPTFSRNGTNSAKNDTVTFFQAGDYTFTVTVTNLVGLTTTSTVSLTVNQTVTALTISPTTASVPEGGTQQFAATALDQFGNALASQPTFSWSVPAGGVGGTVTSAGLYTAPSNSFGSDQVQATSGSVSIVANITVTQVLATIGSTAASWGTVGTTSLQTASDGLRLLPAGRNTDLPWLNINQVAITLSKAATLSPADVTVAGITVANYGPVTITGSGTTFTITLSRPIVAADRVTITVANAGITTYTRRLDVLPGDVNDDGFVTSADVGFALSEVGVAYYVFADLDGDGTVTMTDVRNIRKLNGTTLPPLH